MATRTETEIVLFDLACTKNVCFSPVVWRIRLMLNYKRIPFETKSIEFPDIQPTLKSLDVHPIETSPGIDHRYTVPVIFHKPSNRYIIESALIAEFLESTYPDLPVPLTSEIGVEIEAKARRVVGVVFRSAVMPREINILSPRAREYFRRTREASLGHPLEDLLVNEEESWNAASDNMRAVGELMQTNKADGPFVLGAKPSYTDFFIAGSLQSARVIDEGVFQRITKYPGYKEIYEACLPYMEKKD
ncbi:hypothetical protein N7448_008067 [Penicillium atrosanguineum]|uniref:Uncharacterized protein n=1 Tax=Penicillium atrosanguineum TaxID=1132637 RepID=A0A9W9QCE9_9EURO|nr:uncharacterized protein N7443_000915 [Penicillium atrosanguineum]KAJ5127288.1 hypothetical protein N7448_008067 [Penicillium atrosanguineum]KAJ5147492.1 hypothetical protein N7526_000844 [Penicillium atrosanguineum]KAJ5314031.1 hypothetical protein N7443_000915 [Penicillium atrosanguineum]KAJ5331199.1 hypothetical protein N7476_000982 [Penicillium atrosanguineum]